MKPVKQGKSVLRQAQDPVKSAKTRITEADVCIHQEY